MTGLLAAPVAVAEGIAVLLVIGPGICFQIFCLDRFAAGCADPRTSPGKHPGLSPASTTAVSPSRWQDSDKLAVPGQAR